MKKRVKKWGNGLGIYFDKEDVDIYGFVEGDVIELPEMIKQKRKKKK